MGEHRRAGAARIRRERRFFDSAAADRQPALLPPREHGGLDSRIEDAILEAAGPLSGLSVVDLACGTGDLTLRMLKRGARVTAVDLSEQSLEIARRRVEIFMPRSVVDFAAEPAEAMSLESNSQDLVVGKWALHHLDLHRAAREIHRILRPGGHGVFVETSGLNPLLSFTRRHLAGRAGIARCGTEDERPLGREEFQLLSEIFGSCRVDNPNVMLFFLIDRHLLKWRWPALSRTCLRLDRAIERRGPGFARRASYQLRVSFTKSGPAATSARAR
jgi:SAM-dependent methyltransferase